MYVFTIVVVAALACIALIGWSVTHSMHGLLSRTRALFRRNPGASPQAEGAPWVLRARRRLSRLIQDLPNAERPSPDVDWD